MKLIDNIAHIILIFRHGAERERNQMKASGEWQEMLEWCESQYIDWEY